MSLDNKVQNNESPSDISKEIKSDDKLKRYLRAGLLATASVLLYLSMVGCAKKEYKEITIKPNKTYVVKTITSMEVFDNPNYLTVIYQDETGEELARNYSIDKIDTTDSNISTITLDSVKIFPVSYGAIPQEHYTLHLSPKTKIIDLEKEIPKICNQIHVNNKKIREIFKNHKKNNSEHKVN